MLVTLQWWIKLQNVGGLQLGWTHGSYLQNTQNMSFIWKGTTNPPFTWWFRALFKIQNPMTHVLIEYWAQFASVRLFFAKICSRCMNASSVRCANQLCTSHKAACNQPSNSPTLLERFSLKVGTETIRRLEALLEREQEIEKAGIKRKNTKCKTSDM